MGGIEIGRFLDDSFKAMPRFFEVTALKRLTGSLELDQEPRLMTHQIGRVHDILFFSRQDHGLAHYRRPLDFQKDAVSTSSWLAGSQDIRP